MTINSSSLLASIVGKTLSFTLRGMTVTAGSTIISVYVACNIEKGANQLIYKYMPYKFVDVEHANGLTKEQLDAVKIYYGTSGQQQQQQETVDNEVKQQPSAEQKEDPMKLLTSVLNTAAEEDQRLRQEQETAAMKKQQEEIEQQQKSSYSSRTSFWIEKKKEELPSLLAVPSLSSIPSLGLPQQEIVACSMTG